MKENVRTGMKEETASDKVQEGVKGWKTDKTEQREGEKQKEKEKEIESEKENEKGRVFSLTMVLLH